MLKRMLGDKQALVATAIICLLPSHIISSRYAYGYECGYVFLAFLSIYSFVRYLMSKNWSDGALFSLSLAFYVMTHVLFPFIFIILIWTAYIYVKEENKFFSLKDVFLNKFFILPSICVFLQFLLLIIYLKKTDYYLWISDNFFNIDEPIFYYVQTTLGHHLFKLQFVNYLPFAHSLNDFYVVKGLSVWNLWLLLVVYSIPFGIKEIKNRTKISIFYIWGILYFAPFLIIELFFDPVMSTYVSFGMVPISIYAALFFYDKLHESFFGKNTKKKKLAFVSVLAAVFIYLFFASCYKVFQFDLGKYFVTPKNPFLEEPFKYRSAYYYDVGYKTLSYYLREYVADDKEVFVFDENFRSFLEKYYLGKNTVFSKILDQRKLSLFEENVDKIDIIATDPENKEELDKFSEFEIKANIYTKDLNQNKKKTFIIYGRKELSLPRIDMDTEEYNILYDRKYKITR